MGQNVGRLPRKINKKLKQLRCNSLEEQGVYQNWDIEGMKTWDNGWEWQIKSQTGYENVRSYGMVMWKEWIKTGGLTDPSTINQ